MFENLSERLERSFKILKGQGKITELNVAATLKAVSYTHLVISSVVMIGMTGSVNGINGLPGEIRPGQEWNRTMSGSMSLCDCVNCWIPSIILL